MTQILGSLDLHKASDDEFTLLSPVEFQLDSGRIVIAERGFTFDGGSVPAPLRSIVCPFGSAADMAWLCHDRLYWGHRENAETSWTRLEADDAMLELHHHLRVPEHIAHGSWTAVRAGGRSSWMTAYEKLEWDYREGHEYLDQ